jgi:hypothetical protein
MHCGFTLSIQIISTALNIADGLTHLLSDCNFAKHEKLSYDCIQAVYNSDSWCQTVCNCNRRKPFHVTFLKTKGCSGFLPYIQAVIHTFYEILRSGIKSHKWHVDHIQELDSKLLSLFGVINLHAYTIYIMYYHMQYNFHIQEKMKCNNFKYQ